MPGSDAFAEHIDRLISRLGLNDAPSQHVQSRVGAVVFTNTSCLKPQNE